jgi:hypothetical protein
MGVRIAEIREDVYNLRIMAHLPPVYVYLYALIIYICIYTYMCAYFALCLFLCLSVSSHLSIHLSIHSSIHPSIPPSTAYTEPDLSCALPAKASVLLPHSFRAASAQQ